MNDLISRQAAIYAARNFKVDEEYCIEYDVGFNDGISEVVKMLYTFPSAQPEIIRCSECTQYRRWIDTDICFL